MRKPILSALFITILCLVVAVPTSVMGQTSGAQISGLITDDSGGILQGVKVSAKNVETGTTRAGASDSSGRFTFPQLSSGTYEVQAEIQGFQTEARSGILLTVGRQAVVDFTLKVGQVVEKIVVAGEAPLVESQSATISSLVEAKAIRDLPLNGRSFDQLITLTPGTLNITSKGAASIAGVGNAYSVAGARMHSNRFMIDGSEMIGGGTLTSNPSSVSGENLGVDALAEFRVLTNNYGAQFGKKAGGTINVITKSGTNTFHGSGFEFIRNDNLDARDFFSKSKPEFKRNNFGGSAGGPIIPNKLFVFGNYEGLRESLGQTLIAVVPDANARRGFLPGLTSGSPLRNVGVDPRIRPYLDAYGDPNGETFGDGTAQSINNASRPTREDFFTTRVDYPISNSDSLSGIYRFDDAVRTELSSSNSPNFNNPQNSRHQMLTTQETHIFNPALLNVTRAAFSRWSGFLDGGAPANDKANLPSFAPFYKRVGDWIVGGGANSVGNTLDSLTGATSPARIIINNTFEFEDQISITHGSHAIQVGFLGQRLQKNIDGPSTRFGRYSFLSLEDMMAARSNLFTGPTSDSITMRGFRQRLFTAYIQDDYALSSRITLNLGLRYETLSSPYEVNGQISNWEDSSVNGFRVIKTAANFRNPPYGNTSKLGFAPRLGVAWRPFEGGKTVIRTGAGTFHDELVDWFGFFLTNNPPLKTATISNPPFPNPFSGVATAPALQVRGSDYDLQVPTRIQYNFQIQQELPNATVVSVGYVGSANYHLTRSFNPNTAFPVLLSDGSKFFPAGLTRRNPALGGTGRYITTDANGHYNSLQVEVRGKLVDGLRFQTSYVWAKSLDDASEVLPGEAGGQAGSSQDPDARFDHGASLFDVRNSFNANFNYDVQLGKEMTGLAAKVVKGWQLNGIISIHSGTPFTPSTGVNISRNLDQNVSDRPNLRPGASPNPVKGGPDQYFDPTAFVAQPAGTFGNLARNSLYGPGIATVDVSIFKSIPVTERFSVQFRTEVFNALNHSNFGLPRNTLFSNIGGARVGAAGRIDTTVTSARQLQFGLKLLW